uniref:Centromere/kinetochore protein zw10 n=1 Tax=Phytophthora ramorum TaxID=164328 RepID=H3HAR3_PHYRM
MLSQSELTTKLEETHGEIVKVRGDVVEALRSFYASSSAMSADEAIKIAAQWGAVHSFPVAGDDADASDLQEKMRRLNVALLDAVDRLQLDERDEMAPEAQLLLSLTQREQLKRQVQESKAMLALIEQLTEMDRLLGDVDEAMGQQHFVAAAEGDLVVAEGGNVSEKKIVRVVKLQSMSKKNRLLSQLTKYFACTAVWKDGMLKVAPGFSENEFDTAGLSAEERRSAFWRACEVLDMLTPKLKEIAKSISQHLIKPLLLLPRATVKQTRDDNGAVLKIEAQNANGKCANVVSVLQFIHSELFAGNAELMNQLGDFMWKIPGNLEAQLMNLLQDKIPQDVAALDTYRDALMTTVASLENTLVAIGFSACSNSQLRGFVDQLNQFHSKKRRQVILSSGRDLMRLGYHDSVKIKGATEKCSLNSSVDSGKKGKGGAKGGAGLGASPISSSTDEVESSCFQVPDYRVTACAHEVVGLVHQALLEACTAARDLFLLFRTIVPTLYEDNIANDPRACMLYHNDCLYITYHMLVVGHLYKHRDAGERALTSYVAAQIDEVTTGMKALPSLGALDSEYDMERVESFLKRALYKINGMSSSWQEGLPLAVYNKVMSRVLEPLAKNFVDGVLTQSKISENTGAHLHHLLSLLIEMDPLTTIRDKFNTGSLDMFSAKEIAVLVRSLFRDSLEKKDFLQVLLAA